MNRLLPLSLLLFGCAPGPRPEPTADSASLAFVNVSVVDVESGRVLREQTVVVADDRIRVVGPSANVPVPPGARVVDASGKYLIPGLWDMHVHLFNNASGRPPETWAFPVFVANGVTAVREMWTELASMQLVQQWRRAVSRGDLLAPRVVAAGALVDGPGAWVPNMPEVTTPAEGRLFVRQAAHAGMDFIKVYGLLSSEVYHTILAEAREIGVPVAGHTPLQVPVVEGARAGQHTNEHLYQVREACSTLEARLIAERRELYSGSYREADEIALLDSGVHRIGAAFDQETCHSVARALAESAQWQVPTLVNERRWFFGVPATHSRDAWLAVIPRAQRDNWKQGLEDGSLTYSGDTASLLRSWEATLRVVRTLSGDGVGILVGTDFGQPFVFPGFTVHEEMAVLVQAGLSPLQALRAATIDPARSLNATDSLGTVAPGKLADLILLTANPLADIRNTQQISAVMLNGRYLDRETLNGLVAAAEGAAN